jgi:hypothetical protein
MSPPPFPSPLAAATVRCTPAATLERPLLPHIATRGPPLRRRWHALWRGCSVWFHLGVGVLSVGFRWGWGRGWGMGWWWGVGSGERQVPPLLEGGHPQPWARATCVDWANANTAPPQPTHTSGDRRREGSWQCRQPPSRLALCLGESCPAQGTGRGRIGSLEKGPAHARPCRLVRLEGQKRVSAHPAGD